RLLCAFKHALHVSQPVDLDLDHVESPGERDRRGGGLRSHPDARERGGAQRGGAAMKKLLVLMAVAFVDMIGLMIVFPLMPLYATRLHATPSLIGFLAASFPVAQLAAS